MIQGRNTNKTNVPATIQNAALGANELQQLFAQLSASDVEQFYVAFQLARQRQQLEQLAQEIERVRQNVVDNQARMLTVAPPPLALASLVQLQASGVEDIDLLDRMLERGEEWLDQALQNLQRCQQLGMLDEGITLWCEHALDGAYDWMSSMPEGAETANQQSTEEIQLPASIADQSALQSQSDERENQDAPATEDQLLRKLMSDDDDEIHQDEPLREEPSIITAATNDATPEQVTLAEANDTSSEITALRIEDYTKEVSGPETTDQTQSPRITQPLPAVTEETTIQDSLTASEETTAQDPLTASEEQLVPTTTTSAPDVDLSPSSNIQDSAQDQTPPDEPEPYNDSTAGTAQATNSEVTISNDPDNTHEVHSATSTQDSNDSNDANTSDESSKPCIDATSSEDQGTSQEEENAEEAEKIAETEEAETEAEDEQWPYAYPEVKLPVEREQQPTSDDASSVASKQPEQPATSAKEAHPDHSIAAKATVIQTTQTVASGSNQANQVTLTQQSLDKKQEQRGRWRHLLAELLWR